MKLIISNPLMRRFIFFHI